MGLLKMNEAPRRFKVLWSLLYLVRVAEIALPQWTLSKSSLTIFRILIHEVMNLVQ